MESNEANIKRNLETQEDIDEMLYTATSDEEEEGEEEEEGLAGTAEKGRRDGDDDEEEEEGKEEEVGPIHPDEMITRDFLGNKDVGQYV